MQAFEKILFFKYYRSSASKYCADDDLSDRLNHRLTVILLFTFIIVVIADTYVGKPINCWTPAEFKGNHDTYANSICWLKGSYYLPTQDNIIPERSKPRIDYVAYYQWTPFILLALLIPFLLPRVIWKHFLRHNGFPIQNTVALLHSTDPKKFQQGVDKAKELIESYILTSANLKGAIFCNCICPKPRRYYMAVYFLIKLMYLLNSIIQFFLLNYFLSFNYTSYGIELLQNRFSGQDSFESRRFPRVTMCDFMVRRLGSNQHWYAVQCTLPINMYNELIFLFIWFWLIILSILNLLSIIVRAIALSDRHRRTMVEKYYELGKKRDAKRFNEYVDRLYKGLDVDGFFLVDLIARNTSHITMGKIFEKISEDLFSRV